MASLLDIAVAASGQVNQRRLPADGTRAHRVTVTIGNEEIDGWIDYEIMNSMVEPADGFQLSRPFDKDAWKLCKPDSRVRVSVDGTPVLDGFIDDRTRSAKANTIAISGRDRSGRLVQESIPTVTGFDGLLLTDAAKKLASPWFTTITLSDARNRSLRRGKGHRAAAGSEPAFFKVTGKLDEEHAGRVDPGEMRWNVLEQLCSSIGVLCWSSADGRELVIGEPNYSQEVQYLLRHSLTNGSTVKDLVLRESVRDMYATIEVHGGGVGTDDDFGDNVASFIGTAKEGPNGDGTGKSLQFPKRLVMTQTALQSNAEATRAAQREMKRRSFQARQATATVPLHGQLVAGTQLTLYAPNTLARIIDDEIELDETWLIYALRLRASRREGETTEIMLVPSGTEFVA